MKDVINKLKTLSKKQKVLVSLIILCVVSIGVVGTMSIINSKNAKQDKVSDTSLSSNKKDKDKSVDTEKEDTKEKKDTSNENTDKSQETTSENTNNVVESNASSNVVSNNTNQSTNNTTSNNTSNNTNQSTNTTPPPQVCTGVYVEEWSIGNSGIVLKSENEFNAFWDFWENDPNGFYAKYGHNSFEGRSVSTVDSCGNPVSSYWYTTIIWTD